MKLNIQQQQAILLAMEWYFCSSHIKSYFILCGYAGTGKTTVVSTLVESLGLSHSSVLFVAPTGKATSILRMRGCFANTIHRTFYTCKPVKGGKVIFYKKKRIPSGIQLLVVDETSMVTDYMIEDILSYGVPTILLGDASQLPPVVGKNTYITKEMANIYLDIPCRTDDTTGVLDLATRARLGQPLELGTYKNCRVIDKLEDIKPYDQYDMVICWRNRTRRLMNMEIRTKLGYKTRYPQCGEKLYFLQNRYDISIVWKGIVIMPVNGLICIVLEDSTIIDDDKILIKIRPDYVPEYDNVYFTVECCRHVFDGYYDIVPDTKFLISEANDNDDPVVFMDYAFCISAHQSQGTTAGRVLVINEIPESRPEYDRWLYTSSTRSKYSCDVYMCN